MGGTFNPPHMGHINAAKAAIEKLGISELILIPAGIPPHKEMAKGSANKTQRLEMTRLIAEELSARVSDIELLRTGKSYTADTLDELSKQYPNDELWLIMGTDMFLSLETWHEPRRIFKKASIAAVPRNSADIPRLLSFAKHLSEKYGAVSKIIETEAIEISSTELRDEEAREKMKHLIPEKVREYIEKAGLYGYHEERNILTESEIISKVRAAMSEKRYKHTLGCVDMAGRLAKRYGADVSLARRAAYLHDIAKEMPYDEQLKLIQKFGIILCDTQKSEKIIHAYTGAIIAEVDFGECAEVCEAIRTHTTASADMTLLQKIIWLADLIEDGRDFEGVSEIRRMAFENLSDALIMAYDRTLSFLREKKCEIDKGLIEARNCEIAARKESLY